MPNTNRITTGAFSNPQSEALYRDHWPSEPEVYAQYRDGQQCGGCAFFAPFNADYGLCCNAASRHVLETVFEHFTCPALVSQGWGAHSFHQPLRNCVHCGGFGDTICEHCAGEPLRVPQTTRADEPEPEFECARPDCGMPLDHPVHMDLSASPGEHAFIVAPNVRLPSTVTEPPTCPQCGITLRRHARGRECPSS